MRIPARLLLVGGAIVAGGCSAVPATPAWTAAPIPKPPEAVAGVNLVEVYKSPTCSCCHEWEAYMRAHGWTVRSIPVEDLGGIKARHNVPTAVASCHTAVIAGYVIEGHVPLGAIEGLLRDRPAIDGIALPGMPAGSPGMPGVKEGGFEILALTDGSASPFGSY